MIVTPILTPTSPGRTEAEGVSNEATKLEGVIVMPRKSTTKTRPRDAATLDLLKTMKLPADFPLSPHRPSNRWYKKIKGKRVYFGPLDDPEAALDKYLDQRDDLRAGRKPRAKTAGGVTVDDAVNAFLTAKRQLIESGEVSEQSWHDYYRSGLAIVACFGKRRAVVDLRHDDFDLLRAEIAKGLSATTLANRITRVRSFFKFAYEADLIPQPVKFGPTFRKPKPRQMRLQRAAKPKQLYTAEQLTGLIDAATSPLRAMVLLGINCGLGNGDVSSLHESHIDLSRHTIDYPRYKTGIGRRGILWPETVEAIREALAHRPEPADPADAGLVFLTQRDRRRWVRRELRDVKDPKPGKPKIKLYNSDGIAQQYRKLCKAQGVPLTSFYALRHTFETIAEQTLDFPAVELCMGHEEATMAARYREEIGDDRLRRVAEHVRGWLGLAVDSDVLAKIG